RYSTRRYHPLGIMELPDGMDFTERRCAPDDRCHCRIMLSFHGIALLLAIPAGDRDQHIRITDLAMQLGTARAWSRLDYFTGPHPGIRIFLRTMALLDVHLEQVFHACLLLVFSKQFRQEAVKLPRISGKSRTCLLYSY